MAEEKQPAIIPERAIDSIASREPEAKIIVMGDFNDDPVSESIPQLIKPEKQGNDSLINFFEYELSQRNR
jgi:endonuclease/exonuclease/phosphatase family metal-dependent hydrolase